MKQSQRLILFMILSAAILFGSNYFYTKNMDKTVKNTAATTPNAVVTGKTTDTKIKVPSTKSSLFAAKKSERIYTVETKLVKISFSNIAASINSCLLKNYKESNNSAKQLELIPDGFSDSYMALSAATYPLDKIAWTYNGVKEDKDGKAVSFSAKVGSLTVVKTFHLRDDSYRIGLDVNFINTSSAALAIQDARLTLGPNIHYTPLESAAKKEGSGQYSFNHIIYKSGKDIKKYVINPKDSKLVVVPVLPDWIVLKDLYFLSSFIIPDKTQIKNAFYQEEQGGFAYVGLNLTDALIQPKSQKTYSFASFLGPQEYKELKKSGMERLVDVGWIRELGIAMFFLMEFFFKLTKNYGVAILLLTLLIRGLLWFPSQSSFKHMKETSSKMKIIQPRIDTLKKIYKDDAQKLNEETMKLWQEYKINPFGGCLPVLLQLPIFVALYATLMNMVELKGAYFMLWWTDLSKPDPYFVLPVFMAITTFVQTKMSAQPAATDDAAMQQKIMLYFMPIFFGFLALNWPAGLLLYWSMSNVFSIFQQFMVNKSLKV